MLVYLPYIFRTPSYMNTCGVLLLLFVSDLKYSSDLFDPITFTLVIRIFSPNNEIDILTINKELENIHQWFKSKKSSLNDKKKLNIDFFIKKDVNPLALPKFE